MINSYNVKCHIGYIDFLEVLAELLAQYRHEDAPSEYALYRLGSYDTLLGQVSGVDSRHIQFFTPRLFSADAREVLAKDDRLLTPSVITYAVTEAHNNRQKMSETGSPTLDPSKRYVIVGYSYDYFSKNIGCATGSFLFCNSPLGKNPIEN